MASACRINPRVVELANKFLRARFSRSEYATHDALGYGQAIVSAIKNNQVCEGKKSPARKKA